MLHLVLLHLHGRVCESLKFTWLGDVTKVDLGEIDCKPVFRGVFSYGCPCFDFVDLSGFVTRGFYLRCCAGNVAGFIYDVTRKQSIVSYPIDAVDVFHLTLILMEPRTTSDRHAERRCTRTVAGPT
jgi:hypothetical protein